MRNYKGNNNPNFRHGRRSKDFHNYCPCGKEITSRSKHCRECQNIRQKELIKGDNNPNFHQSFSEETKQKMHDAKIGLYIGKDNPNWNGGVSDEGYSVEFNESLKSEVRDRDNHTCQNPDCYKTEDELGETLCVHHIDYDKMNCLKENLISLCLKCHLKTNYNRDYWFAYFTALMLSCSSL